MGCAKNIVDSEKLLAQLKRNNIEIAASPGEADITVINTCGFIGAAKEESVDMIVQNVQLKAEGKLEKVYAMGCLSGRYTTELAKEIPEVDAFFGANRIMDVVRMLGGEYKYELLGERVLTTPGHFAYLKISEGCDNPCSFCAIPLMRGRHVSRSIEEVVGEATLLAAKGVKELVVIGQDTTYYGLDVYGRRRLPELLRRLGDIEGIEWVRLMYAYPAKFPREVLSLVAQHPRICKYIDLPVQHSADKVLRSMRRGISKRVIRALIDELREKIPGVTLRTTLIVGYPDEGDREFNELLDFVHRVKFDRLGVFTYSQEDGTTAYPLGDPVTPEEKMRRRGLVMEVQKEISRTKNEVLVGTSQKVIIDRKEDGHYVGRTERDAPEIDNEVIVRSERDIQIGTFCSVDIVDASEYDLVGRLSERAPAKVP
jgi:ribosomal protein S12 methylthiotransferase